jgi:hypothetical protein
MTQQTESNRRAQFAALTGAAMPENPAASFGADEGISPRTTPTVKPIKEVRCSCGHIVPAAHVLRTDLGTSCPRCYDEMS